MSLVEQWMNSKKKTYWKCWESKSLDYVEGTWNWVLFYTDDEDDIKATYDSGIAGSEAECVEEIEKAITIRLRNFGML